MSVLVPTEELAGAHYAEHNGKPFYPKCVNKQLRLPLGGIGNLFLLLAGVAAGACLATAHARTLNASAEAAVVRSPQTPSPSMSHSMIALGCNDHLQCSVPRKAGPSTLSR